MPVPGAVPRVDRVAGAALLALAAAFSAGALRYYAYWDHRGPGPAFLPFWLGLTLGVLALLLFLGIGRPPAPAAAAEPAPPSAPGAWRRPLVVLVATAVFIAVMPWVGMILGTALFVLGILRGLEGFSWRLSVGVAVGTAAVNYLVFSHWLRVPFPQSPLGI
jgi:putative tricarboxylic transport membrane protein